MLNNMNDYKEKIIVTMTSWRKRLTNIPDVLDTVFKQTIKPDKIVINLSSEEFPDKEKEIPAEVLEYINKHNDTIIINWVDGKNIKSWKKTIPTFKLFPNDCIICIDDDLLYKETFIETLWKAHLKYPNNPISYTIAHINRYFIQHCGNGALDKKCYYDDDIEKWLSTDITNFGDEDSFMTFMAVRHGNRPISCGHFTSVTTPFKNDNGIGGADLWKAYYWISNVLNDKFENYIKLEDLFIR